MIRYEWVVEEVSTDKHEEIGNVAHFDTLAEAKRYAVNPPAGMKYDIGLVRDVIASDENLEDRQWAYLHFDGTLPDTFDDGAVVPQRFHSEALKYAEVVAC